MSSLVSMGSACSLCREAFALPFVGYLGPGGAVSSIGALLALIVGLLAAILGFIWYPFRRLLRRGKRPKPIEKDETGA
jgi:hypothetical protein